jgi:hypothetical protein
MNPILTKETARERPFMTTGLLCGYVRESEEYGTADQCSTCLEVNKYTFQHWNLI